MTLTRVDLGVWCINLDRATERWERMAPQLTALDLPVTRFSAVDGRADPVGIAVELDAPAFRANMGRDALPTEVGCYLSHLSVWEAFLASDKQHHSKGVTAPNISAKR